MNPFDRNLRLRAQQEAFTVSGETEKRLWRTLLCAESDRPPARRSPGRGWAIAAALLLCAAVFTLTGPPIKDETVQPLTQPTVETPIAATLAPEPEAVMPQTDWRVEVSPGKTEFHTVILNPGAAAVYIEWQPIMDPLADAALAQSPREGFYLTSGQQVEDQAVYYSRDSGVQDMVLSIRWTVYELLVPVHAEETWAQEPQEALSQQERLEQAVIEGQIAVVDGQLALSDSFAQAYQQSPLAYYTDHGMMQQRFSFSDRKTVESAASQWTQDALSAQPVATVSMNGYTARFLQVQRLTTAPYVIMDLQFDSQQEQQRFQQRYGECAFVLRPQNGGSFASEQASSTAFVYNAAGHAWTQRENGQSQYHLSFLSMSTLPITPQELADGLAMVPFARRQMRYDWDGAIALP